MHKKTKNICENLQSFPTRERGLKYVLIESIPIITIVVPHAGTWIEMAIYAEIVGFRKFVVPHAGTWIEIVAVSLFVAMPMSFPTRERGLKS